MSNTTDRWPRVLLACLLAASATGVPACGSPGSCSDGTGFPGACGARQGTILDVVAAVASSVPGPSRSSSAHDPPTAGGDDVALESTGDGMGVRCVSASGWEDIVVTHGDHTVVSTCELMNGEPCACDPEPE